jgi:hypothetical protein
MKLTIQDIKNRLFLRYGNEVIIDESSYEKASKKCFFIHAEFGSWEAKPNDVLNGHSHKKVGSKNRSETCQIRYGVSHVSKSETVKEKKKLTTIKNYGVSNPLQNPEIALKQAKSSNLTVMRIHWKTGIELVCQGSYESSVVDYLNKIQADYLWQPKVFTLPSGKTYRPDLFLVNENKWIEIKGFMRKDAQEKWDWFQSAVPNSCLWDKKQLISLGILRA